MIGISLVTLTACGNKNTTTNDTESSISEVNSQSGQEKEIKEYEDTNNEVMNFTDSVQVPSEFNAKKTPIVYESENYKIYDETDFGYIQNLDDIRHQSFEFVVECLDDTSCDLTNKSFSYQVGDDLYYSTQFTTTGPGFLNNENYQFISFEVEVPAGESLDSIYFNQEKLTQLTSDNITSKIEATNSTVGSTESEGDVSVSSSGESRL